LAKIQSQSSITSGSLVRRRTDIASSIIAAFGFVCTHATGIHRFWHRGRRGIALCRRRIIGFAFLRCAFLISALALTFSPALAFLINST